MAPGGTSATSARGVGVAEAPDRLKLSLIISEGEWSGRWLQRRRRSAPKIAAHTLINFTHECKRPRAPPRRLWKMSDQAKYRTKALRVGNSTA